MGGSVQFSDITHLRYWSGAGHNKEVRDRLGLISPPIARAQRGEVYDHEYKDVSRVVTLLTYNMRTLENKIMILHGYNLLIILKNFFY